MTLEQARTLVKLNQTQLAKKAGVTKFAVSDIETGMVKPEKVSHGTIMRIVYALRKAGIPGLRVEDVFPVDAA